jgi:hypothetical protein
MSERKVIPFRKRPPSGVELEVYRRITRNWHPTCGGLLLPEHFKRDPGHHEAVTVIADLARRAHQVRIHGPLVREPRVERAS